MRNARVQPYGERGQVFRHRLDSPIHNNSSAGVHSTITRGFASPTHFHNNASARVQPPRATSANTHDFNPLAVEFVPGLTWMKHGWC